jgi:dihydrofolate synthase/folylpolyglutamate synthase
VKRLNPKNIEIPSKTTYKLDRILMAAAAVGNPQFGRKCIIVAGTNGKGSTCEYLTQLFLQARRREIGDSLLNSNELSKLSPISSRLRVGTYISPHVMYRTERIRVDGRRISELELQRYEKKYAQIFEPLSYFERLTLLAFLYFRDQQVDLQILEVGIGGRLDATNISDPDLSVVTRIDYDHQEILGRSLSKIAREKAGVMRKDRRVFISEQSPEADRALAACAKKLRAPLVRSEKQKFSASIERVLNTIERGRGHHQRDNACLALTTFLHAARLWNLELTSSQIHHALRTELPVARIQVLRKKPLFIIDGSHNENSMAALDDYLKIHHPSVKFHIVFGLMNDKTYEPMLRLIRSWGTHFYFPYFYLERQVTPTQLKKWEPRGEVVEKLSLLIPKLWSKKSPVLVVGSLYLAGEVLKILEKQGKPVLP